LDEFKRIYKKAEAKFGVRMVKCLNQSISNIFMKKTILSVLIRQIRVICRLHGQIFCSLQNLHSPHPCVGYAGGTTPWMGEVEHQK